MICFAVNIIFKIHVFDVVYVSTYTHSPQCVPSRSAMWTGLRTDQTKTWVCNFDKACEIYDSNSDCDVRSMMGRDERVCRDCC